MSEKASYHIFFLQKSHRDHRRGCSSWQPVAKLQLTSLAGEQTIWRPHWEMGVIYPPILPWIHYTMMPWRVYQSSFGCNCGMAHMYYLTDQYLNKVRPLENKAEENTRFQVTSAPAATWCELLPKRSVDGRIISTQLLTRRCFTVLPPSHMVRFHTDNHLHSNTLDMFPGSLSDYGSWRSPTFNLWCELVRKCESCLRKRAEDKFIDSIAKYMMWFRSVAQCFRPWSLGSLFCSHKSRQYTLWAALIKGVWNI